MFLSQRYFLCIASSNVQDFYNKFITKCVTFQATPQPCIHVEGWSLHSCHRVRRRTPPGHVPSLSQGSLHILHDKDPEKTFWNKLLPFLKKWPWHTNQVVCVCIYDICSTVREQTYQFSWKYSELAVPAV